MSAFLLMNAAGAQTFTIGATTLGTTLDFDQEDEYVVPVADPRVDLSRHLLVTPDAEIPLDEFVQELSAEFPKETRDLSRLSLAWDADEGQLKLRNADGPIVGHETIHVTCLKMLDVWVCWVVSE
jgi:hypothetical protein